MLPPLGSISRRMRRPSVLFPDPDSPTSPSVSPFAMSNDTPSTARTSPEAPPPNMDSPKGKVLVRFLISSSAIAMIVTAMECAVECSEKNVMIEIQIPAQAKLVRGTLECRLFVHQSSCDERNRGKRGNDASDFPAGELFFEEDFGEHNGYDRIERTKNDRGIKTPRLRCADKENASAYVEQSGEDHRDETRPGQLKGRSAEHHDSRRDR